MCRGKLSIFLKGKTKAKDGTHLEIRVSLPLYVLTVKMPFDETALNGSYTHDGEKFWIKVRFSTYHMARRLRGKSQ